MLEDPEKHFSECAAADGGHLRITMRGSVTITTTVMGKRTKVRLTDVNFAENLERSITSYGLLEGCGISYRGQYRVVAALNEGPAVFDVGVHNNVVVVRAQKCEQDTKGCDV